ncbi:MAG: class I SAM-dependent methyltransferase [Phycisphaerales bacterium]|nr:class I SAM-dependent methyltransferase [Phycisphaerales bacterium]
MTTDKQQVANFWNQGSCGEKLYLAHPDRRGYEEHAKLRYELEPLIPPFAEFPATAGKRVLEIGVGLGADHQRFAEAGAELYGIDLTERAIDHTRRRLDALGLRSVLAVGDAEDLTFANNSFDVVYSWGVLHHSPDSQRAISEVFRVLKVGGIARIMIYSKWSLVGVMLWTRYALLRGRPWISLSAIYAQHLESPGTKAYTVAQARRLMREFQEVDIATALTHGDTLTSQAGQRHEGTLLRVARKVWPRTLIRLLLGDFGLFMLIKARKTG